ncbi:hypothetical protein J2S10_005460 [Neobacillus ginsengisoli]|uniref:Uncharacterized protein n=1 Tax=Neobacillus ginsengisoli TaxID=904295 RepID=A0ABT9Y3B8_9BACI|nr:hypothetical protein [Neobacillus ginsengisoli]
MEGIKKRLELINTKGNSHFVNTVARAEEVVGA